MSGCSSCSGDMGLQNIPRDGHTHNTTGDFMFFPSGYN